MPTGILDIQPVQGYTPAQAQAVNATATSYAPTPYTSTGYTSTPYTSNAYTATPFSSTPYTVTPEGLVQQQVKQIVGNDSPLMQQARTKALQTMNARGLLNSSMAVQAGQEAVIAQSLPIAQADAGAYNTAMTNTANAKNTALTNTANAQNAASQFNTGAQNVALTNTANAANAASQFNTGAVNTALTNTGNAANAASQFGAAAQNTTSQLNAQLASNMNLSNATAKNTALSQEAQAANTRSLALIDNQTKLQLATLDTQNRTLLQTSVSAANMQQELVRGLGAIAANENMTPEAKNAASQSLMNAFKEGLATQQKIATTLPTELSGLSFDDVFNGSIAGSTGSGSSRSPVMNPDGSQTVTNADGTQKVVKPNGTTTTSTTVTNADGSKTLTHPDGSTTIVQSDGTKMNFAKPPPTTHSVYQGGGAPSQRAQFGNGEEAGATTAGYIEWRGSWYWRNVGDNIHGNRT